MHKFKKSLIDLWTTDEFLIDTISGFHKFIIFNNIQNDFKFSIPKFHLRYKID